MARHRPGTADRAARTRRSPSAPSWTRCRCRTDGGAVGLGERRDARVRARRPPRRRGRARPGRAPGVRLPARARRRPAATRGGRARPGPPTFSRRACSSGTRSGRSSVPTSSRWSPAGASARDDGPGERRGRRDRDHRDGPRRARAYPHLAVDPVPALCRVVLALQETVRSALNPLHPAVVSVTAAVGCRRAERHPDTARAAGTVRTMHAEDAGCSARPIGAHRRGRRGRARLHAASSSSGAASPRWSTTRRPPGSARPCSAGSGCRTARSPPAAPTTSRPTALALPILMLFVGTGEGTAGPDAARRAVPAAATTGCATCAARRRLRGLRVRPPRRLSAGAT